MMTSKGILQCTQAEPFWPFRIHMASGRTFDIRHPEMIRVGRNDLVIFSLVSDDPRIHYERSTVLLVLIKTISHLEGVAAHN